MQVGWNNTVPFKKFGLLNIYEVKWGHFNVKYSTWKVLPSCWASVSTKIWFRPFKRGTKKVSMSFVAKLETIKFGGQKLLGTLVWAKLLGVSNFAVFWPLRLYNTSCKKSNSNLFGAGSSRS